MTKLNPLRVKTCIQFVLVASGLVAFFIFGMKTGVITFFPMAGLPRDPSSRIWFMLAQVFAVAIPILLLVVYRQSKEVQATFLPFLFSTWLSDCDRDDPIQALFPFADCSQCSSLY